jgi:hypothetical protein
MYKWMRYAMLLACDFTAAQRGIRHYLSLYP